MITNNLKLVLIATTGVGVAIALLLQHQSGVKLQEENLSLREKVDQMGSFQEALEEENQRLSNQVLQLNQSTMELLRLRGEVGLLRGQASELKKLREENRQLVAQQAPPQAQLPGSAQASPASASPERTPDSDPTPVPQPSSGQIVIEGRTLFEANQLEQAEQKFREALRQDPTNQAAYYYLNVLAEKKRAR